MEHSHQRLAEPQSRGIVWRVHGELMRCCVIGTRAGSTDQVPSPMSAPGHCAMNPSTPQMYLHLHTKGLERWLPESVGGCSLLLSPRSALHYNAPISSLFAMCLLRKIPKELLHQITDHLVLSIGIAKALRLRCVCRRSTPPSPFGIHVGPQLSERRVLPNCD